MVDVLESSLVIHAVGFGTVDVSSKYPLIPPPLREGKEDTPFKSRSVKLVQLFSQSYSGT